MCDTEERQDQHAAQIDSGEAVPARIEPLVLQREAHAEEQREERQELEIDERVEDLPVEPGQALAAAERDREAARLERQEHLPDVGPEDAEQREAAQGVEPGDARGLLGWPGAQIA